MTTDTEENASPIELGVASAHLSPLMGTSPPYYIHGVALGVSDVTRGQSGQLKKWPADALAEAADTLEGTGLYVDHNDGSARDKVGEVTKAKFKEDVGVIYEAKLVDESLAEKIAHGILEVSITAAHPHTSELEEDEETGALVVDELQFISLSIVDQGAAPSNTVEMGRAEEMSAATLRAEFGRDDIDEDVEEADDDVEAETADLEAEGEETDSASDSEEVAEASEGEDEDAETATSDVTIDRDGHTTNITIGGCEQTLNEADLREMLSDAIDEMDLDRETEDESLEEEADELSTTDAADTDSEDAGLDLSHVTLLSDDDPVDPARGKASMSAASSLRTLFTESMTDHDDLIDELEEYESPVVLEEDELEDLQEKAEFREDLDELKERTSILDEVDRSAVEELRDADDPEIVERAEYEELQSEVEGMKESLANEIAAEVEIFETEELMANYEFAELREKHESLGLDEEEESAEELSSDPTPKSGDPTEEELAEEETDETVEEAKAELESIGWGDYADGIDAE